jgi:hypothetical protein
MRIPYTAGDQYVQVTCYLWATPDGYYFVTGMHNGRLLNMNDMGDFKAFVPGGNIK